MISFGDDNFNISLEVCLFLENDISGDYSDERTKFGGAIIFGNFNTQILFTPPHSPNISVQISNLITSSSIPPCNLLPLGRLPNIAINNKTIVMLHTRNSIAILRNFTFIFIFQLFINTSIQNLFFLTNIINRFNSLHL